jgi:hypothetical protein
MPGGQAPEVAGGGRDRGGTGHPGGVTGAAGGSRERREGTGGGAKPPPEGNRYWEMYLMGSQTLTMPEESRVTPHTQKGMPGGTAGHGKFGVVAAPLVSITIEK